MPWCESPGCGKNQLLPTEIVFDDRAQLIRCLECHEKAQALYAPEPKNFEYQVFLSSSDGLVAKANYKGFVFSIAAPIGELESLFGRRRSLGAQ